MKTDVLIIGGGLAGLSCATTLTERGVANLIVEADHEVGGRARTDRVKGFLLDRGFQVFSTAYPEAKRIFNYAELGLKKFYPGSLVRFRGQFHRVADPFRNPYHACQTLFTPIGTLSDKIRVAVWRHRSCSGPVEKVFRQPETSTRVRLEALGFSQSMIDRFWTPFLGGVFMDQALRTSSRLADFVVRMFASGDIALPGRGIGALAQQLANHLAPGHVQVGKKVDLIEGTTVTLQTGETIRASHLVIATDGYSAKGLFSDLVEPPWQQTTCLYFCAPASPITGPYLILNGERTGVINSMCVPSEVAPSYAPPGSHLISVTTRDHESHAIQDIEDLVRNECHEWFGTQVEQWQHLRTYRIPRGQPLQRPPFEGTQIGRSKLREGLFICGDHQGTATFNGAIGSGRRAAEEIMQELSA